MKFVFYCGRHLEALLHIGVFPRQELYVNSQEFLKMQNIIDNFAKSTYEYALYSPLLLLVNSYLPWYDTIIKLT